MDDKKKARQKRYDARNAERDIVVVKVRVPSDRAEYIRQEAARLRKAVVR